jgi:hypothetical protein
VNSRPDRIMAMAGEAQIAEAAREPAGNYVGLELRGLHEGNVSRYRLHSHASGDHRHRPLPHDRGNQTISHRLSFPQAAWSSPGG